MLFSRGVTRFVATAFLLSTFCVKSESKDNKKTAHAKPTKDVVTSIYNASVLPSDLNISESNAYGFADSELLRSFSWDASIFHKIASSIPESKNCAGLPADGALIIHLAQWKVNSGDSTLSLLSSNWYAYRRHGANTVAEVKEKANKQPLLYAVRGALLIGINFFDDAVDSHKLKVSYKVTATDAKADNVVALGQLIAAVMSLTLPAAGGEKTQPDTKLLVAAGCKGGAVNLPFDFNFSFSLAAPDKSSDDGNKTNDQKKGNDDAGQVSQSQGVIKSEGESAPQTSGQNKPKDNTQNNPNDTTNDNSSDSTKKQTDNGVVDCSTTGTKKPCTFTRTFRSDDIEWWDVSIGVTVPGVKEAKYTLTGNTVQRNLTTHTEFYGLFDIYPLAKWKTKETWVPHFNFGIPLTSQPFYRPYFGLAENFTSWTTLEKHGFPFRMSFYAGVVDMKQSLLKGLSVGSTATQTQFSSALLTDRALKPLFGIEVPVSALIDKIGKKSSSSNSTNSGNSNTASKTGGNQ